jgi:Arc/MetJ-type ribon-helix-helix transcriptional regulator
MNKPVNQVTVTLSAEDAADLQARVERGEFASLDEGVAAELAELNYRRAADIVGGSEKLEALLDELEAEVIDPDERVDGLEFLNSPRTRCERAAAPAGKADD